MPFYYFIFNLIIVFLMRQIVTVKQSCFSFGSRSAAGPDSRIVLQVRLRCTEGSVRWVHPGQALRVVLEPNLSSSRSSTVCIQPSPSLGGASVFVERSGQLHLLGEEEEEGRLGWQQVFCFQANGSHRPAIYIQGSGQSPGRWRSRVGFRYEVGSVAPQQGEFGLRLRCNNNLEQKHLFLVPFG